MAHASAAAVGRPGLSLTLDQARQAILEAISPGRFFVRGSTTAEWEHGIAEEIYWEVFQTHLLDGSQTRQRRTFEAWNVYQVNRGCRSAEPIVSIKLDTAVAVIHVVRAVLCHAWEAYSDSENVILGRETVKWTRELIGSIDLAEFCDIESLHSELTGLLFQAVVGVSRLPLTSVEAPLPGFTLGEFGYFGAAAPGSQIAKVLVMRCPEELISRGLQQGASWLEKAKLLELLLRATAPEKLPEVADSFGARWEATGHDCRQLPDLLRAMFEEVALSPYTDFVEKVLKLLRHLEERVRLSTADIADFFSYLLRHIVRHLTAYDLVTFHHRGANYPDALLLDAALKGYFDLIERRPELFLASCGDDATERSRRLRRRALRQGLLLRRRYEGHLVPDAPTSPGENLRVLPPPFVRVPDEQILDPSKRSKKLYDNDPLEAYLGEHARAALRLSILDLHHPPELRELGMAVFLDRPLGVFKQPGERDQTLLLSYEAFSRSIAVDRLRFLTVSLGLVEERAYQALLQNLEVELVVPGVALPAGPVAARPGVVSLDDAWLVARDFVLLRTTRRAVQDFLRQYDLSPLARRCSLDYLAVAALILRGSSPGQLTIYDDRLRKRLELEMNFREGYAVRRGVEYLRAGLRVLGSWEPVTNTEQLKEQDLRPDQVEVVFRG